MFISTKSDGQISVNLIKKRREKKLKILSLSPPRSLPSVRHLMFLFCLFFSLSRTHMSLFLPFSVCFNSETIFFIPISISFILIEYSLNICHFLEFFKKSRFQVSLYICHLEIRKIFRLSRNSTKLFLVTRFHEANLTAQSVSSSEI